VRFIHQINDLPMTNSPLFIATTRAALGRVWGTALLEMRLNLFSPAPWVMGLVLAAFGYLAVRTAPDDSSFALGWILSHDLGPLAEILLLFLAGSFAYRPQRYDVTELQESKMVAPEEISGGRWMGMTVAVLVPLMMQYGVTMIAQMIHSKEPVLLLAYAQSFARLLPSVLFLTTLSFCLVSLTRVLVLGAGLVGLTWFILYFGQAYYPSALRIELSQNRFVYLGLTAAVFLLLLLGNRGRRRAKRAKVTYGLATALAAILSLTVVHAAWVGLALPGKATAVGTWQRLQDATRRKSDPLPNFAWSDYRGRRVSLASLRGKPALLVFVQPKDGKLVALLGRLARLRTEFARDGLSVLAICLSEDLNGARDAAAIAGAQAVQGLPIVTDWGQAVTGTFEATRPGSAISWALRVRGTPTAVLVGADGREVLRGLPLDETTWPDLKLRLQAALRGESG